MNYKNIGTVFGAGMAVLLCGCNSTHATVGTAVMQQPAAKCHVGAVPFSVTLSANDIDGKQTKLACYGQDGVGCKLRIYQIMVESFNHSDQGAEGYTYAWGPSKHNGNIKGITEKLDYIKSTGANAIWFTPVFVSEPVEKQDHNADKLDGTGYYTSDYFTVDPKFGTKAELKELVEKDRKSVV